MLTSNLALTHYNPYNQIYVASDASNFGLGVVILHKKKWQTKTDLTCIDDATSRGNELFADIKEGLAIIFALKKFHNYVHGRDAILQTDLRPLLTIFGSKKKYQPTPRTAYKTGL